MDGCWIDAAGGVWRRLEASGGVWRRLNLSTCISTVFQHCVRAFIAFLSCSSTFLCAHPYGIPALSACIPTNLQHSLHAFFCMSIACVLIWTASPLCAFLLCSSTVGVHFYCIAALFACFSIIPQYYIPALYACISIYIQALFWLHLHCIVLYVCMYCMCIVLYCMNTVYVLYCMCLYVFVCVSGARCATD